MAVPEVTTAVVLQILRAVAPATADTLSKHVDVAEDDQLLRQLRHIHFEEDEPALLQMVSYALEARERRKLSRSTASTAQQVPSKPEHVLDVQPPARVASTETSLQRSTARDDSTLHPILPAANPSAMVLEDADFDSADQRPSAGPANAGMTTPRTSSGQPQQPPSASVANARSTAGAGVSAARGMLSSLPVRMADLPADSHARLRLLLFGHGGQLGTPDMEQTTARRFSPEWLQQGLSFSDIEGLQYMLVQPKGGPCGPLASVNAEALRFLYYRDGRVMHSGSCAADAVVQLGADANPDYESGSWADESSTRHAAWEPCDNAGGALDGTAQARQRALVLAIATMIWRCRPSGSSRRPALLVVPKAGQGSSVLDSAAVSLRVQGYPVLLPPDGVSEKLALCTCESLVGLLAAVESNIDPLSSPHAPGLVCVLYSCILTRGCGPVLPGNGDELALQEAGLKTSGMTGILADVDPSTLPMIASAGLVGSYSYASQEVVNLLLTGRASSNVFDGTRVIRDGRTGAQQDDDSGSGEDAGDEEHSAQVVLHGVSRRSDVGFLSVLAPLGYLEAGANLSRPRAPVWVVFAESHYSVLFAAPKGCVWPPPSSKPRYTFGRKRTGQNFPASSTERCLGMAALDVAGSSSTVPTTFDIVYCDGLARQDELMRLTVELAHARGSSGGSSNGYGSRAGAGAAPRSSLLDDDAEPSDTELSSLQLWCKACWGRGARAAGEPYRADSVVAAASPPHVALHWNDTDPWEPMRIDMKKMGTRRVGR